MCLQLQTKEQEVSDINEILVIYHTFTKLCCSFLIGPGDEVCIFFVNICSFRIDGSLFSLAQ